MLNIMFSIIKYQIENLNNYSKQLNLDFLLGILPRHIIVISN